MAAAAIDTAKLEVGTQPDATAASLRKRNRTLRHHQDSAAAVPW